MFSENTNMGKSKKKKTLNTNIRNKKGDINIDPKVIKMIKRNFHEQFYTSKFNISELTNFLKYKAHLRRNIVSEYHSIY